MMIHKLQIIMDNTVLLQATTMDMALQAITRKKIMDNTVVQIIMGMVLQAIMG